MAWVLFLLFIALPIAEIAVLIQAGDLIGLWPTIGLVILTAAAGAALARAEGRASMQRLAQTVDEGGTPIGPLLDAAAIFVGAILLLTPGFITDFFGLSLLFWPTRFLWGQAMVWLQRNRRGGPGGRAADGSVIIEAEYVERETGNHPPGQSPPRAAPPSVEPPSTDPRER